MRRSVKQRTLNVCVCYQTITVAYNIASSYRRTITALMVKWSTDEVFTDRHFVYPIRGDDRWLARASRIQEDGRMTRVLQVLAYSHCVQHHGTYVQCSTPTDSLNITHKS